MDPVNDVTCNLILITSIGDMHIRAMTPEANPARALYGEYYNRDQKSTQSKA
jgi:hypothetical protein